MYTQVSNNLKYFSDVIIQIVKPKAPVLGRVYDMRWDKSSGHISSPVVFPLWVLLQLGKSNWRIFAQNRSKFGYFKSFVLIATSSSWRLYLQLMDNKLKMCSLFTALDSEAQACPAVVSPFILLKTEWEQNSDVYCSKSCFINCMHTGLVLGLRLVVVG